MADALCKGDTAVTPYGDGGVVFTVHDDGTVTLLMESGLYETWFVSELRRG